MSTDKNDQEKRLTSEERLLLLGVPPGMKECPYCSGTGIERVWNDDVDTGIFGTGPNPRKCGDWDGTKRCRCTAWVATDVR